MSATLDQSKGSASLFGRPLNSLHDVFGRISNNWDSIYNGGDGGMIQSSGGALKFGDRSITFCEALQLE
jgi:hypothetical protein